MSDVRGKICKCSTKKIRDFSILFCKNILRFAQNCVNLPSKSENILRNGCRLSHIQEEALKAWGQENDIKMDDGRWKRDEG